MFGNWEDKLIFATVAVMVATWTTLVIWGVI